MVYSTVFVSPVGPLRLTSDGEKLTGLWMREIEDAVPDDALSVFQAARAWLDAYFAGENPSVSALPLSPSGTDFQHLVWEILLTIPLGETRTYGEIARLAAARMGRERMSAQAVGRAVGSNPISIIIPCHRVIGANGALTGYAGGLKNKEWLLRHEEEHK